MNRPWMPLYIADYLADTAHLNASQSGAYLHLIMHYWQTGKLPAEDQALARIARMTPAEWAKAKSVIAAFFQPGWRHKRIDAELEHAAEVSRKRRASAEQRHSKRSANAEQTNTQSQSHKKETEAIASDADASRDVRTDLFREGLATLAKITGKTPDSCRSLVGKWLKSVNDEAIHVLGAIQDAERNRVADPVAWIGKRLTTKGNGHAGEDRSLGAVARRAAERACALAAGTGLDGNDGIPSDRLLPPRASARS